MLPSVKTVLFPTDIGPQSINVLRHAEALAVANAADVVLLHVIEPLPAYALGVIRGYMSAEAAQAMRESGIDELRRDVETRLQAFLDEESSALEGSALSMPTIRIAEGSPAATILSEAKALNADVIVMGTHGHSTLGEIVMGSVVNKVLHKADIPVLVIPYRGLPAD